MKTLGHNSIEGLVGGLGQALLAPMPMDGVDVFPVLSLFAGGEQGAWYDPSDLSTLFQDAAGTIPVTASGQPVGMIRDKSGRGNHATQSTAASRPTYTAASGLHYLLFDGVDDFLVTGSINFTATDKMTVWAGVTKLSDAAVGAVLELSTDSSANAGVFAFLAPNAAAGTGASWRSGGTMRITSSPTGFASPNTSVYVLKGDIAGDVCQMRRNGADNTNNSGDQGTGNYGNYPLYIGRRGGTTLPFNGRLYGLIIRGAASTTSQIIGTERYLATKTGLIF